MELFLLFSLIVSIVWSCCCTAVIIQNENTINYLTNTLKELEKENKELHDRINEITLFDSDNNEETNEIDWSKIK